MEVTFINIYVYMSLVCLNALYALAIAFINTRHIRPLNYPYTKRCLLYLYFID